MRVGGHRFLGSHHQKCLIFGMWYLKYILRCCTEFFFWIFDFRGSFSELENWEFEEKNWKKNLKFFCSDLSFTKNKSFLRQILRQPWNFFSKKVIFECFQKRKTLKNPEKSQGSPLVNFFVVISEIFFGGGGWCCLHIQSYCSCMKSC